LRQLDRGSRCLLSLLLEALERKQHAPARTLLGEQDAVDHPIAVNANLPDVPVQMSRGDQAAVADISYAGEDRGSIAVGERIENSSTGLRPDVVR
jgi:hypothetical protein